MKEMSKKIKFGVMIPITILMIGILISFIACACLWHMLAAGILVGILVVLTTIGILVWVICDTKLSNVTEVVFYTLGFWWYISSKPLTLLAEKIISKR